MDTSKPTINIEQFAALDLRIGTILTAERVPETDKLVKFTVDLGDEQRQIIGGFAPSFPDPAALIGQQVPVLVNLDPRVMRGLESQGMILAAATDDGKPVPLQPTTPVPNGTIIR